MINFTESDVHATADCAWAAMEGYAQQHGACQGCLSIQVVLDMLYHVAKNTIVEEHYAGFVDQVQEVLQSAMQAKQGGTSLMTH